MRRIIYTFIFIYVTASTIIAQKVLENGILTWRITLQ